MNDRRTQRITTDFGQQWLAFPENKGWYGSTELFEDIISPLLELEELKGKDVAEIGSGTGRIVSMLLSAHVRQVIAIEPSAGFSVLAKNVENIKDGKDKIILLQKLGEEFLAEDPLDYIFSIGVLHHIPDPYKTVQAAYNSLKPGGRFFVWLYGREGNEAYLRLFKPIRAVTTRLPHHVLQIVVGIVYLVLVVYRYLCQLLSLPLKSYIDKVLWPLSPENRRLVIYDQLNPTYAKYYTREQAENLLAGAGFVNIRLHHRHGYSWSVIGTRPKT